MKFEPGKVLEKFEVGGREVVFRYPKKDDIDGLLNYINTLVRDREYIGKQKPATRQEEMKWLREVLKDVRKAKKIHIIVELDEKIVGSCEVKVNHLDAAKHVGEIAIGLSKEAQNMGIGTKLIKILIEQSKLLKLKVLEITVFELNERARHVYEKVGFKYAGKIPKSYNYYGKYAARLIYYMEILK